jgi:creatinine amidohydrolase/Fe(II)-dependent formamide hydrolase-like protein
MAVRPELVKLDRAVEGWPDFPDFRGPAMPTIFAYFETRPASTFWSLPEGVWGDPRGSSAELGETFYAQITKGVCNVVGDITEAEQRMRLADPGSRPLADGRTEVR